MLNTRDLNTFLMSLAQCNYPAGTVNFRRRLVIDQTSIPGNITSKTTINQIANTLKTLRNTQTNKYPIITLHCTYSSLHFIQ